MKQILKYVATAIGISASSAALSQAVPIFPDGAIHINTADLQEGMARKAFTVETKGEKWTVAFETNGRFVFMAGSWKEAGKWTSNKSEICGKDYGGWCNEIRMKDNVLFLKSSRGILPMEMVK